MKGRRRWLVLVGGALLALIVLVVVPSYVASQPTFFRRFPGMADRVQPWSVSTHAMASCQSCHVPPDLVSRAVFQTRMAGEFYMAFIAPSRQPDVFARPTNAACLSCHIDLRAVSPKGDLKIPHRAHVEVLKMRCVDCHEFLVHENSPEGKHTPTMAGCLRCHNGDKAKNTCTACHTNKAAPASHKAADWKVIHPKKATEAGCNSCHRWTDRWCADCHSRRPASHGADWRAVHGAAVAKNRDCEVCHDKAFCIRCHGELPKLNYDPNLKPVR